jgi:hypothetical protein
MTVLQIAFWVVVAIMAGYLLLDGYQKKEVSFWRILVLMAFIFAGVVHVGKPD